MDLWTLQHDCTCSCALVRTQEEREWISGPRNTIASVSSCVRSSGHRRREGGLLNPSHLHRARGNGGLAAGERVGLSCLYLASRLYACTSARRVCQRTVSIFRA